MTRLRCLTIFLTCLTIQETFSTEPTVYTINTKKWSHVLDDHFISVSINPTDLLQGRAFGLGMNSTLTILKGLSPAYIRIGSADTSKYTFKRSRLGNDEVKPNDELIVTESHWMILNEVAKSAGLDVIVCLNLNHRNGATNKWDTRNSLELISFSDSQGYNLTFQLGYEVQKSEDLSGVQFGKDLNRLRTILNAFPRYQNSKLIGPDIKILHKKEDVDFISEMLIEAGPTLDAVTWHPRWPQPSKMKISDISELGYEFPADYLDWDRIQLNKILQRTIFKNPVWIGEPKTESTGTFAEGLLWARRLLLAARQGIEVVMKQPSLMDISHPKPEYWIALLHKRLLGKSVLDTRSMINQTDMSVITHCTNSLYWSDKPDKTQDGAITVYAVNMGGFDQKIQIKGGWSGKPQYVFQFVLTSGSDPDSVFSQMTYLNGEPLMMTDDGLLPDITPKVRRLERSLTLKMPPYSVGFWVVPEAKVRICQLQPLTIPMINLETLNPANMIKNTQKSIQSIRNINQFIVEKLTNPIIEPEDDSTDNEEQISKESAESAPESVEKNRLTRRAPRQVNMEEFGLELKKQLDDIRTLLDIQGSNQLFRDANLLPEHKASLRAAEQKIDSLTNELATAVRSSTQEEEFAKFLEHSGLKSDFGQLMMKERGIHNEEEQKGHTGDSVWDEQPKESCAWDEIDVRGRRPRRDISEELDESVQSEEKTKGYWNLKDIEDSYKQMVSNQIQKDRKKVEEIKKKRKKDEGKELPIRLPFDAITNDIQEEILMKEIEVLEKTEETMSDLMRTHKQRQETIEDLIRGEINEIKEDRMNALEEIRQQKKMLEQEDETDSQEYKKHPKNVMRLLKKKGGSDINKNREENLEEILKNFDVDKNPQPSKRSTKEKESKLSKSQNTKKEEEEEEEKKEAENQSLEVKKEEVKPESDKSDMIRKIILKKGDRAKERNTIRDRIRENYNKIHKKHEKEKKKTGKENSKEDSVVEATNGSSSEKTDAAEETAKSKETSKEETKSEETPKEVVYIPLKKNDETRRTDVLKRISDIVEKADEKEKTEDLSDEFEIDGTKKITNRKPRTAQKANVEEAEDNVKTENPENDEMNVGSEVQEQPKRESKLVQLRNRILQRKHNEEVRDSATKKRQTDDETNKTRFEKKFKKFPIRFDRKKEAESKETLEDGEVSATATPMTTMEVSTGSTSIEEPTPTQEATTMTPYLTTAIPTEEIGSETTTVPEETTEETKPEVEQRRKREIDDNSSEERIRYFKKLMREKANSIRKSDNEIPNEGKEDFLKMAKSTARFMFDDVIPEAYDKTKEKIRNLGISEYFQEFGKILEEMKNLDQVFVTLGKTAIKGYMEGDGNERGEHIQVISRRKRNAEGNEEIESIAELPMLKEEKSEPEVTSKNEEFIGDKEHQENLKSDHEESSISNNRASTGGTTNNPTVRTSIISTEQTTTPIPEEVQSKPIQTEEERKSNQEQSMAKTITTEEQQTKTTEEQQTKTAEKQSEMVKEQQSKDVVDEQKTLADVALEEQPSKDVTEEKQMPKMVNPEEQQTKDVLAEIPQDAVEKSPNAKRQTKTVEEQLEVVEERPPQNVMEVQQAKSDIVNAEEVKDTSIQIPKDVTATAEEQQLKDTSAQIPKDAGEPQATIQEVKAAEEPKTLITEEAIQNLQPSVPQQNDEATVLPVSDFIPTSRFNKVGRHFPMRPRKYDREEIIKKLRDNRIKKEHATTEAEEALSPWIRTTREFIQQAMNSLQKQKELTEILARESLNDLVKREIARKVIGKREVYDDRKQGIVKRQLYPIYRMESEEPNGKRIARGSDSESPYLNKLPAGVYVVPSKDMTNIRSEQVSNHINDHKTGEPKVVTLNIYYDKTRDKNQPEVSAQPTDPRYSDYSRYYRNAWDQYIKQEPVARYVERQEPQSVVQYVPYTEPDKNAPSRRVYQTPGTNQQTVYEYVQPQTAYEYPKTTYQEVKEYEYPKTTYQESKPVYEYPKTTYQESKPAYEYPKTTYQESKPAYEYPRTTYQEVKPAYDYSKTTYQEAKPVYEYPKPTYTETKQVYEYQQPKSTYVQPAANYQKPVYQPQQYSSQQSAYKPQEATYEQQEPVYQQQEPVYQQPEPVYQQPEPVYQQPEPNYPKPEEKSAWTSYKSGTNYGNGPVIDQNWDIQFEPVKKTESSGNQKLADKKRSVEGIKYDPNWAQALPFWNYIAALEKSKKEEQEETTSEETTESNSTEDLFVENRKRAKNSQPEVVNEEPEPEPEGRKKRSIAETDKNEIGKSTHKIIKRWIEYIGDDHENIIFNYPITGYEYQEPIPSSHELSRIINLPWFNDKETEVLFGVGENSIKDVNDVNLGDEDDYFLSDNLIYKEPARHRRSTDDKESMIKTNTIQKIPIDNDIIQHQVFSKKFLKKLTDPDSSLEVPGAKKENGAKINDNDTKKNEKTDEVESDDFFENFLKYVYDSMTNLMKKMSEMFD